MILKCAALCLALAFGASAARAELTITVGNNQLQPGVNNIVPIYVHGGDAVDTVQIECQIEDGALHGPITAPTIGELDLVTTTSFGTPIFGSNYFSQTPPLTGVINYWLATRGTITNDMTVSAEGLLATVTISTVNFTSGSWALKLTGTRNGSTTFGETQPTISNGTIFISDTVPEPATGLLLAAGAALLLRRRRAAAA
jgi:hypothetical protein